MKTKVLNQLRLVAGSLIETGWAFSVGYLASAALA